MGKLISVSAFAVPSLVPLSASQPRLLNEDVIVSARPATAAQIAKYPQVTTEITVSIPSANGKDSGTYLVAETIAALVTASN